MVRRSFLRCRCLGCAVVPGCTASNRRTCAVYSLLDSVRGGDAGDRAIGCLGRRLLCIRHEGKGTVTQARKEGRQGFAGSEKSNAPAALEPSRAAVMRRRSLDGDARAWIASPQARDTEAGEAQGML